MSAYPFTSALVTGASSGIGEELVRLLSDGGVSTVAVARRADRLNDLASTLVGVEVLVADLETPDGQRAVVDRITDPGAPIDLVVNNAGFGTSGRIVDLDPDRLAREVELNVAALTRISHAALSVMVPRQRGWLLNTSSVAGFQPAPYLAVYAATKAYVTSLSESLHEEVRGDGVTVTALCPGLTRTEFQHVSQTEHYQSSLPGFAWSSPADVAEAALTDLVKGRALSVPGAVNKIISATSNSTPRWARRLLSNVVQRRP